MLTANQLRYPLAPLHTAELRSFLKDIPPMRLQSLLDALVHTGLAEAQNKLINRNVSSVWHDVLDQQKRKQYIIYYHKYVLHIVGLRS